MQPFCIIIAFQINECNYLLLFHKFTVPSQTVDNQEWELFQRAVNQTHDFYHTILIFITYVMLIHEE